jgi:hypothetical protein
MSSWVDIVENEWVLASLTQSATTEPDCRARRDFTKRRK